MKAVLAEASSKRYKGLDIKINNGVRDFTVSIDKENLKYEEFKNIDMHVNVYALVRNCCSGKPVSILESGTSIEDDNSIRELINSIDNLIGDKLKEILI